MPQHRTVILKENLYTHLFMKSLNHAPHYALMLLMMMAGIWENDTLVCQYFQLIHSCQWRHNNSDLSNTESVTESVDRFSYCDSTVTSTFSVDEEINTGKEKADVTFWQTKEMAWSNRRLRRLGHVATNDSSCIPKQVLKGELVGGRKRHGRPKLSIKIFVSHHCEIFLPATKSERNS